MINWIILTCSFLSGCCWINIYLNEMGDSKFNLDFNVTTEGEKDPSDNIATLTIEAVTDINLGVERY